MNAHRIASELVDHFGFLWTVGLVGVLVVSIGMYRAGLVYGWQGEAAVRPAGPSRREAFPLILFVLFLLAYLAFMFWKEDFAFEDPHSFTGYSAIGVPRPPSIWIDVGRFWPLGYLEYNLISQLSRTATAYLVLSAIQLVIGLWMLYDVMPVKSPALRLGALAILMMAPGFAADFAELTYADRNVCFAICVLLFCIARYDRRPSLVWMIPSVAVGYAALYYKEITAALIGTFAVSRILLKHYRFGWRNALRSPLEIGLILAGACFAVQLLVVILPTGTSRYIDEGFVGRANAAARYFTAHPLLTVFVICFAIHVFQTLRRGRKFDPLWDTMALGGVLHLCAAIVSGLVEDYLLGPTELVAILTLVRIGSGWWEELPRLRVAIAGMAGLLAISTITFGTYRLVQRKTVVIQTQSLARFLIDYYHTPGNEKSRLYFRSNFGIVANFASYLAYRGLPIHHTGEAPGTDSIKLAGSESFPNDVCAYYDHYVCHQDEMRMGDLVMRNPLDGEVHWPTESPRTSPTSGMRLQPLIEVRPAKSIPLLSFLYRVSPDINGNYRSGPVPDEWASFSVSKVVAAP